jgi:hypothetical protein
MNPVNITVSDVNGVESPYEFCFAGGRKAVVPREELTSALVARIDAALASAKWEEYADVGGPDEPVFVERNATVALELSDEEVRSVFSPPPPPISAQPATCRGEMICREFSTGDGDCCCGMRYPGEG